MSTTQVDLFCRQCGSPFSYPKNEYTRQTGLGRLPGEFYCSIGCGTTWRNQHRPPEDQEKISAALSKRSKGNSYRKKGNFVHYLNKARNRKQYGFSDIDDEYLSNLWNKQQGKCALTNIPILLKQGKSKPNTASLDRIDSSLGYIKGNVQFVAYSINLAKCDFSNEEFSDFLREVISI